MLSPTKRMITLLLLAFLLALPFLVPELRSEPGLLQAKAVHRVHENRDSLVRCVFERTVVPFPREAHAGDGADSGASDLDARDVDDLAAPTLLPFQGDAVETHPGVPGTLER